MKWHATFYTQMLTVQIEAKSGEEAMRKALDSPEYTRALDQFKVNHPDAPPFPFDFGRPGPRLQILVQPVVRPRSKLSVRLRQLRTCSRFRVVSALLNCPCIARWYYRPVLEAYRRKRRNSAAS